MLPTLIRRAAQAAARPESAHIQRIIALYPPKKVWPPDFKRLSVQEQLRFEKKYKRRLALATARPRWDKFIKLLQLFSIVSILTYSILFMDWGGQRQPFEGVRQSFWEFLGYDYKPSSAKPVQKGLPGGQPQARSM